MWSCNRIRCSQQTTTSDVLRVSLILFILATGKCAAAQPLPSTHIDDFTGHPRVIVISDIGNEPDDQMSLVRFLMYSNELDIEGLIPTTSTWQKAASHPETMHALIQAYGQVRSNLLLQNLLQFPNHPYFISAFGVIFCMP